MSSRQLVFRDVHTVYENDWILVIGVCLLSAIGSVMIASASYDFSLLHFSDEKFLLNRHSLFLVVAFLAAATCYKVPMIVWERFAPILLLISFFLLAIILIPNVGYGNKGATRWLKIAGFTLQVSEVAKFCLLAYLSSYLVRQQELVRNTLAGFLNPLLVISLLVILLLAEPDFGAVVVLVGASLGMLFLGGVKLGQFLTLVVASVIAIVCMIFSSDYRRDRFFAYLDPWAHRLDGGYQLIESLIAVGRGQWMGSGLGNSVQKQFYLPEAHNDFIFAVLCEELGFIGGVIVIALFAVVLLRIVSVARCAELIGSRFSAYFCYGVALIMFIQLFINVGVNIGLLPTKGLTLPFLSYGGSSLLVSFCMIGVVLRVNYENVQALDRGRQRKGKILDTKLDAGLPIKRLA